jgi:hypothetical protein
MQMLCWQVHGQRILSSFALLELACAAGRAAADDGATLALALVGATFGAASTSSGVVECQLQIRSGSVHLCTLDVPESKQQQQHMSGCLAAVPELPASGPTMQRAVASSTIVGVLHAALRGVPAVQGGAFCSIKAGSAQRDGFWMHPAAAEAVAGLQAVLTRPCMALRPVTCGAVLCHSRRAAAGKLHASVSSRRMRRSSRAAASLAAQLCSGEGAFEVADLEQVTAEPILPEAGSYTTIWQPVTEPSEAQMPR